VNVLFDTFNDIHRLYLARSPLSETLDLYPRGSPIDGVDCLIKLISSVLSPALKLRSTSIFRRNTGRSYAETAGNQPLSSFTATTATIHVPRTGVWIVLDI
jgi:hypothetical protein